MPLESPIVPSNLKIGTSPRLSLIGLILTAIMPQMTLWMDALVLERLDKVTGHIQNAARGGATIQYGYAVDPGVETTKIDLLQGCFVRPTFITDVKDDDDDVMQEDVVGPVVNLHCSI